MGPLRWFVFLYIQASTRISKKIRLAKELSLSPETSLDSYDPILFLPATELARRIRSGELTSKQVVATYIERIKRVNPFLNAIVADRFSEALKEAEYYDRIISSGNVSNKYSSENMLFLGVPVTIKECIAVKGMPNTYGLWWRTNPKYSPAPENSPRVNNLIKSGFIVLGVTNNPELLLTYESYNQKYGRTSNPYDLRLNPGGSSSGEGAIVGAAGSVIGLGTDIAGSIRMPAFFCGCFGHKTTSEWIPKDKPHYLLAKTKEKTDCATSGPICRYAEDIAPFLSSLIGRDIGDPASVDVTKLRIVAMPEGMWYNLVVSSLDPDLHQATIDAANYLGQQIVGLNNLEFVKAPEEISEAPYSFWPYILTGELPLGNMLGGENHPEFNPWKELILWVFGRSNYTWNAFNLFIQCAMSYKNREDVRPYWDSLRTKFDKIIGDNGVLLFPSHPIVAMPQGTGYFNHINMMYTGIFNVFGYSITEVPMGLNKNGIPLGVQVVARKGEDLKAISVAIQLGKRFGGWVPPRRFGVPTKNCEVTYTNKTE